MNIGLDIDGVITDICLSLNNELEKLDYVDFDYSKWLLTVHNCELSDSIFSKKLFWKNLKPFYDSWHQINNWWSLGHDVFLITSRRSEASMETLEPWLDSWKILHSGFYFTEMGKKIDKIKDLNIDFMIEDNPYEAMTIEENGTKCLIRRSWYNSDFWEDFESIGTLFDVKLKKPSF